MPILLALAALPAAPGAAAAGMCVATDVQFTGRTPPAAVVKVMANEAASIWDPYGVHLAFTGDSAAVSCAPIDASFEVVVEHRTTPRMVKSRGPVLGSTYLQFLTIDHAPIRIDVEAINGILDRLSAGRLIAVAGHPGIFAADTGRALGRVLAHEIGHVLLAAPNHQQSGLMRASFPPEELVSVQQWSFTLSKAEVERLRRRQQVLADAARSCRPLSTSSHCVPADLP
jgi:hypothetical protein